ncbi:MAG TPA: ribonuclease Z [Geobacteraceae bacterium]
MKPLFLPSLVNGPFDDPGVYVDFLFARRALLFDLGDLSRLPARKILRLGHVFVSHTHMDHFIGFDHLIRIMLGREKRVHFYGPAGFVDQVGHRLSAYTWNLVSNYPADVTVVATEMHADGTLLSAEFRCRLGFRRENDTVALSSDGLLLDEDTFRVRAVVLDHSIPCLAFALEEKAHVNVMKNRLEELGVPVGPWLTKLRLAVLHGEPDDTPWSVRWQEGDRLREHHTTLGELKRGILTVVKGEKIAYVTDTLFSRGNAEQIVALVREADYLFIETPFSRVDGERAGSRYHLTAHQAGLLARAGNVARVFPFHFSPKYRGNEMLLREELAAACAGEEPGGGEAE